VGPEQLSIDLSHLQEQVSESRVKFTGHLKGSQVHSQVERLRSGLFGGHCFSLSHSHWQSYSLKNGALGGHSAARAGHCRSSCKIVRPSQGKNQSILASSVTRYRSMSKSRCRSRVCRWNRGVCFCRTHKRRTACFGQVSPEGKLLAYICICQLQDQRMAYQVCIRLFSFHSCTKSC